MNIKNIFIIALFVTTSIHAMEQSSECFIPYHKQQHETFARQLLANEPNNLLYPGNTLEERVDITMAYLESTRYQTFVKMVDGKPTGFVNYFDSDARICCINVNCLFGRQGVIHLLAVDQQYRNKGHGTDLLYFVIKKLKPKVRKISLMTSNMKTHKFYEKAGFKIMLESTTSRWYQMNGDQ